MPQFPPLTSGILLARTEIYDTRKVWKLKEVNTGEELRSIIWSGLLHMELLSKFGGKKKAPAALGIALSQTQRVGPEDFGLDFHTCQVTHHLPSFSPPSPPVWKPCQQCQAPNGSKINISWGSDCCSCWHVDHRSLAGPVKEGYGKRTCKHE